MNAGQGQAPPLGQDKPKETNLFFGGVAGTGTAGPFAFSNPANSLGQNTGMSFFNKTEADKPKDVTNPWGMGFGTKKE
jgi:hypothetical protein